MGKATERQSGKLNDFIAQVGESTLLRALIETACDDLVLIDDTGYIVFCGIRVADMLGYTVPELVGQPILSFFPIHLQLTDSLLSLNSIEAQPTQLVTKSGALVDILCNKQTIYDEQQRCTGVLLVARKSSTTSAVKSQDAHTQVLEESNHRVRNNLAMICALLDMEMMQAPEDERQRLRVSLARTKSLSLVHNQVQGETPGQVEVGVLARAVVDSARSLFAHMEGTITVDCATHILLPVKRALNLSLALTEIIIFLIHCGISHGQALMPSMTVCRVADQFVITIAAPFCMDMAECCQLPKLSRDIITGLIERSLGGQLTMSTTAPFHAVISCPLDNAATSPRG